MKHLRWILGVVALAVVSGFLGLFAVLGPGPGSGREPVRFTVEEGASLHRVARDLEDAELIRNAGVLRAWARFKGQGRQVRAGQYELVPGASVAATLQALVAGPLLTEAVTLPEGWTLDQTIAGLVAALELDAVELDSLVRQPPAEWEAGLGLEPGRSLEGYLFPETYRFVPGVSATTVVGTLVAAFTSAYDDALRTRADSIGMTTHEVVTLASIVEAEALIDEERPSVAAVYLNRIAKGWKLEADPTVAYALDKIGERLTFRDLEVDSPYNTYRNQGLPPGPINSPGLASLKAVLFPREDFDAMYFVADGKGGHRFSRTWEEHQAAVREYRQIQRERRGGG